MASILNLSQRNKKSILLAATISKTNFLGQPKNMLCKPGLGKYASCWKIYIILISCFCCCCRSTDICRSTNQTYERRIKLKCQEGSCWFLMVQPTGCTLLTPICQPVLAAIRQLCLLSPGRELLMGGQTRQYTHACM